MVAATTELTESWLVFLPSATIKLIELQLVSLPSNYQYFWINWTCESLGGFIVVGRFVCLNWPNSQIPQCTCPLSHNTPFCNRNVHMCAHLCYKMLHCGTSVWCIVGFVRWVYSWYIVILNENWLSSHIEIIDIGTAMEKTLSEMVPICVLDLFLQCCMWYLVI